MPKNAPTSRPLILVLLTASSVMLTACTGNRMPAYADAYREALDRHQGTTEITDAMTDRFAAFFSHRHGEPAPEPGDLYGQPLYFSDTLLTTEDRGAVLRHVRRMHEGTSEMSVEVLDRLVEGQDVYLVWQMRATFRPGTGAVTSNTIGVSHLRFGTDGRIILQQDFWDSTEGLYRHVPILGGLVGLVRGRFSGEPAPM